MRAMSEPLLQSTLTCPACGHSSTETMPTNACVYFHECAHCGVLLRPEPGDCCVFCSYGSGAVPAGATAEFVLWAAGLKQGPAHFSSVSQQPASADGTSNNRFFAGHPGESRDQANCKRLKCKGAGFRLSPE